MKSKNSSIVPGLRLGVLLSAGLSLSLTSCVPLQPGYQASVDILHAGAKEGRLNHSDYEIGKVLRLDRKNKRLTEVSSIPVEKITIQRVPSSGEQTDDSLDSLTEYDITLTVPTGGVIKEIQDSSIVGQVASHYQLDIQNYHYQQPDIEADALANDQTTYEWRRLHKDKLIAGAGQSYLNNPNYIYVVVNKAYYANKAELTSGAPDGSDGKPGGSLVTKITLGGKEIVNVTYKHQSKATRTGDKIPAIVYYDLYLLKESPKNLKGSGIMFANIDNIYSGDEAEYKQIQRDFAKALRNSRIVE